ncbi:MAG: glycosyltransferase family 39 protein [Candidatus Zixiibacteriota bacterium]|nr:MAG: glycosyltransferase family 39 protein [candidate division Zixibacteria bacterium]
MKQYRKSLVVFLAFIIVFELLVILVGDLARPSWSHWSDEWHFQNTIKRFGNEISLYNLKHYEEMSTPLPFLIYALWGRLVGFDLFHLRMFSVIVALLTYVIFHRLLYVYLKDGLKAFWGAAFLAAQPYMIGLSIFVFTDMMAILLLLVTLYAHVKRKALLFGVFMALAILSRQYLAFLTLAAGIYYAVEFAHSRGKQSIRMLLACVISAIPFALLALWWGGPTPANTLQLRYLDYGFVYHAFALSLYICLIVIYLFPLILVSLRRLYTDYRILVAALVGSAYYFIFPVQPTQPTINVDIATVGLFHRLLKATLGGEMLIHSVFYVCFLLAMPVVIHLLVDCYLRLRRRILDRQFYLDLAIISFFFVMPFSYLSWEKYFMPAVPLFVLRAAMAQWQTTGSAEDN